MNYAAVIIQTTTMIAGPHYLPVIDYRNLTATPSYSIGAQIAVVAGMYTNFADEPIGAKFEQFAEKWRDETMFLSATEEILGNKNYLSIIALGKEVLPYVFTDLNSSPSLWFPAIEAIVTANGGQSPEIPKEAAGNVTKITEIWLNWAQDNHYL